MSEADRDAAYAAAGAAGDNPDLTALWTVTEAEQAELDALVPFAEMKQTPEPYSDSESLNIERMAGGGYDLNQVIAVLEKRAFWPIVGQIHFGHSKPRFVVVLMVQLPHVTTS